MQFVCVYQGALYLRGEDLKVVWAEFSTLSYAILLSNSIMQMANSKVENLA